MIVICKDDSNLPPGGEVIRDNEYEVLDNYLNSYEERVYILKGINNEGFTKSGMKWVGYRATRFSVAETISEEVHEHKYELA
jgi:hypothetical protein